MIGFRLTPASHREDEADFPEQQIHRCERCAQAGIGQAAENIETIHPTPQERARALQRHFTRSLYALEKRSAAHGPPCRPRFGATNRG